MNQTKRYRGAFAAVTSLFFMWGFITVLADSLIPRLKEVFEIDYWQAAMVQVAWFVPYGLLSIPAGFMLARTGYKRGILIGLALAGLGCLAFYPAAEYRQFSLFMAALFTLASGITMLQVAANPYITVLGSERGAAGRLNLAQAFNSLGTTLAPVIAASWLLSDRILTGEERSALSAPGLENYLSAEASAVEEPFLLLALAFAAMFILLAVVRLPLMLGSNKVSFQSFIDAFKHSRLRFGAVSIFVYVGAEVAIGSFLTNYFLDLGLAGRIQESPQLAAFVNGISQTFSGRDLASLDAKGVVATFGVFYWGSAMLGRFFGAALMQRIRPAIVLAVFAVAALLLLGISVSTSGFVAAGSILLVGFCNSVMFPTIFSLSLEGLGDLKPEGSGILCTAIVGGAFIPPLTGLLRDLSGSFSMALLIPLLCYFVILAFARFAGRKGSV